MSCRCHAFHVGLNTEPFSLRFHHGKGTSFCYAIIFVSGRTTLRDIAEKCGCTVATVSRALRDRPEISSGTRARVKAVAAEMGYVPDPALAALVQHRNGLRSDRYLETLALISPEMSWEESRKYPRRMELISALRGRARELGYKVEFVHLPPDLAGRRATADVLSRRRIRGVVVLASDPPAEEIAFPWNRFAAIRLYRPPVGLRISTVDTDLFQGVHLVLDQVAASPHRRLGLVLPDMIDRYTCGVWRRYIAMVLSEQADLSAASPFIIPSGFALEEVRSDFLRWFKKEEPDVLLSFAAMGTLLILREAGVQVPQQVGVIDLDVSEKGELAGLMQSRAAIGRTAIDQLHALLLTNSIGLPDYPVTSKIAFHWVDGPSFRRAVA